MCTKLRCVVQRVSEACVRVEERAIGQIGEGLLALVGVEQGDGPADAQYIAQKLAGLRIFEDDEGKMNRDVLEAGGGILLISQFTLSGDVRKGKRPSFSDAAPPDVAQPLYETVADMLRALGVRVALGQFQAHMRVSLINDGPVTILLSSKRCF